jgi:hypothetical protein
MAGSTITSHPAGTRRRTSSRRPSQRRRPAVAGSRKKRTRRKKGFDAKRWWPALVVAAAVLVGVAWDSQSEGVPPVAGQCTISGSSVVVTGEQVTNARIIAQVARDRGLPDRAVVIALATAQQESRLRNLDHGDRDSLGLFQQRPSQGWGTPAQVQDPEYAAGQFFDRLVEVPRWRKRPVGEAADAVQRSAFPELVPRWEPMARALTRALDDDGELPLRCS